MRPATGIALILGFALGAFGAEKLTPSTFMQVQRVAKTDNRTAVEIRADMERGK